MTLDLNASLLCRPPPQDQALCLLVQPLQHLAQCLTPTITFCMNERGGDGSCLAIVETMDLNKGNQAPSFTLPLTSCVVVGPCLTLIPSPMK